MLYYNYTWIGNDPVLTNLRLIERRNSTLLFVNPEGDNKNILLLYYLIILLWPLNFKGKSFTKLYINSVY